MKNKAVCLLAVLYALLFLTGASGRQMSCIYYDEAAFMRSVSEARIYPAEGRIRAGVVPHHLLAGGLIASFFATVAASDAQYDTVLFIAPSHYSINRQAVTARGGWRTPFGVAEIDVWVTERLAGNARIDLRVDMENMELDHAVSGLIPYAKYYLPDVSYAAVLLPNQIQVARLDALAETLIEISRNRNILLVCSVDFSHYQTPGTAARRDEETRHALEQMDERLIRGFHDDHMDSPETIITFMRYLKAHHISNITFWDHAEAGDFIHLPPTHPVFQDGTTTYFILGGVEASSNDS